MAIVAQSSFGLLVLPLLLLCCSAFIQANPSPPNIILLLADDLGWSQTSVPLPNIGASAHSSYIETPNLARLADNGMRFSSGYASAPICTPRFAFRFAAHIIYEVLIRRTSMSHRALPRVCLTPSHDECVSCACLTHIHAHMHTHARTHGRTHTRTYTHTRTHTAAVRF